jgi:hypothetical protein
LGLEIGSTIWTQINRGIKRASLLVAFEKDGIEENRSSNQNTLVIGSALSREVNDEGICISEEFRSNALWLLENNTIIRGVSICVTLTSWVDAEGLLAASLSTWVSFGAAIDTHSTEASLRMNKIDLSVFMIENLEGWDTIGEIRFRCFRI